MKMVFWGYNNYGEVVLDYFLRKGYNIPLIITPTANREKIKSLSKIVDKGVIVISITEHTPEEIIELVKNVKPDVMLSCSFKHKIPSELLCINGKKIINIHGALLPEYRGANMLNWLIIKGQEKTGVTLHYMDAELDAGDILAEISYPILFEDDANSLKKRMYQKTLELFDNCWNEIVNNRITPIKQDHTKAYYYPGRKPSDGLINWHSNAIDVYNLVRALVQPFPGAFTFYNGKKVIIERAEIIYDNRVHFKSGRIVEVGDNFIVATTLYNKIKINRILDAEAPENTVSFTTFKKDTFFSNE